DGVVYAGGEDGTVRAIDGDGFERWTTRLDGPIVSPPSVDLQGRPFVLVGGSAMRLVALDAAGRTRWTAAQCWQPGAAVLWPALVEPSGFVVVGNCALDQ